MPSAAAAPGAAAEQWWHLAQGRAFVEAIKERGVYEAQMQARAAEAASKRPKGEGSGSSKLKLVLGKG